MKKIKLALAFVLLYVFADGAVQGTNYDTVPTAIFSIVVAIAIILYIASLHEYRIGD